MDGTAGEVSVVSVIRSAVVEMDRRYKLWDRGEDVGPHINIIWDETLASIAYAPDSLVDDWLALLREARKVRIRLIVLPHNDRVESLGIEGRGAEREHLTYVRLGKAAIARNIARDLGESRDQHKADSWGVKASSCPCNHPKNVSRKPRQSRACPLLNSQFGIPQPPSFFGRGVFSGTGKLSRKSRGDAPNPLVAEGSIPSGIVF